MRRVQAILAASAITVALAACGGSSGGSALSQSEYKSKTDAACNDMQKQLETEAKKIDISKASDVKGLAKTYANLLHDTADKLRKIGYPKGKKDTANEFYDAIDTAADKLSSNPDVLQGENAPAEFKKIDDLAKELGITSCGNG
jgi:hypothetical protein